jgi:hypothetical protein
MINILKKIYLKFKPKRYATDIKDLLMIDYINFIETGLISALESKSGQKNADNSLRKFNSSFSKHFGLSADSKRLQTLLIELELLNIQADCFDNDLADVKRELKIKEIEAINGTQNKIKNIRREYMSLWASIEIEYKFRLDANTTTVYDFYNYLHLLKHRADAFEKNGK